MTEQEILDYIEQSENHIFLYKPKIWSEETDLAIPNLQTSRKIIRCSKFETNFINADYFYTTSNRTVTVQNLGHGTSELVAN